MTSRKIRAAFVLLLCALGAPVFAANPSLQAYQQGIQDPLKHSKALALAELTLDLEVVGTLADGTLTARFYNPSPDLLEGRFAFELPAGAVVTGYALDVGGALVDGVLVEPLKARRSYEAQVRRGIDPGLAEVSRANVFSTQVYPLMPRGSRTIRLKFSAPMDAVRGLVIPLVTTQAVGKFSLNLRAGDGQQPPEVRAANLPGELAWHETPAGLAAGIAVERHVLNGELRIGPPGKSTDSIVSRHPNGRRFFQIAGAGRGITRDVAGARLRIYWDRSLSRRDDRLAEERALVGQLVAQMRPAAIDLVSFNSSGARLRRMSAGELDGALRTTLYRGATSFRVLEKLDAPGADVCLVFSDGVATIDPRPDFRPGCEVLAITSAPDADMGFLGRLVRHHGGEVLRLGSMNVDEILARMSRRTVHVVDARSDNGSALDFAMVASGSGGWTVVGEARETRAVTLRIAGLRADVVERRYALVDERPVKFSGAGALWAAARAAALAAEDGGHEALTVLSRQFSVAGPSLSFLVLENPRDYVEADIAPPANYPKESLAEYRALKADYDQERRANEAGRLDRVVEQWNEQKTWWGTKFERQAPKKIAPGNDRARRAQEGLTASAAAPPMAMIGESSDEMAESRRRYRRARIVECQHGDESVAGLGDVDQRESRTMGPRPALSEGARLGAGRPRSIAYWRAKKRKFGALPAFYFDVAEWLHPPPARRRGASRCCCPRSICRSRTRKRLTMVADRMQRYGRTDRAVWLYERLRARNPTNCRSRAAHWRSRWPNAPSPRPPAAARRDLSARPAAAQRSHHDAPGTAAMTASSSSRSWKPTCCCRGCRYSGRRTCRSIRGCARCSTSTSASRSNGTPPRPTWTCGWTSRRASVRSTASRARKSAGGCRTT